VKGEILCYHQGLNQDDSENPVPPEANGRNKRAAIRLFPPILLWEGSISRLSGGFLGGEGYTSLCIPGRGKGRFPRSG